MTASAIGLSKAAALPVLRTGTVLVYQSQSREYRYSFVIRIASFNDGCYFEWEGETSQGMVYLKPQAFGEAKRYCSQRLFQTGVESESAEETTYWLSRRLVAEIKKKKKVVFYLDSLKTELSLLNQESFEISLNQKKENVIALTMKDGRGGLWWILDDPTNPLVLQRKINSFTERLASIDSTRTDTLRWIKGRKLKQYSP